MLYWGLTDKLKRAIVALLALDSFTEYISFLYKVSYKLEALKRLYAGASYPVIATILDYIGRDQIE